MQYLLVNRAVLVLVLVVISALFLFIIKPFLVAIFLAALFSALFHPLYEKIMGWLGGRNALSALVTMLIAVCFVFIPVSILLATVFSQALDVTASLSPWIQQKFENPEALGQTLSSLPFYEQLLPFQDVIKARLGELFGFASKVAIDFAQAATVGTFNAVLMGFIVLYTMFFFLMDGDRLLYYILYYLPLRDEDEKKLLARFKSVTRATLKGTAVIGMLQGTLAGMALAFGGVPSALFWAVAMMFLSVVPGIGTALIWIPAVIYIGINSSWLLALGIGVFCAVVVGSVDNILRPKLVGSDTQLHELMIFFSTLGGLFIFGFWGFVIGPIIAALFVTVWELYGEEFSSWLPTSAFSPRSSTHGLPGFGRVAGASSGIAADDLQMLDSTTVSDADLDSVVEPAVESGFDTEDAVVSTASDSIDVSAEQLADNQISGEEIFGEEVSGEKISAEKVGSKKISSEKIAGNNTTGNTNNSRNTRNRTKNNKGNKKTRRKKG